MSSTQYYLIKSNRSIVRLILGWFKCYQMVYVNDWHFIPDNEFCTMKRMRPPLFEMSRGQKIHSTNIDSCAGPTVNANLHDAWGVKSWIVSHLPSTKAHSSNHCMYRCFKSWNFYHLLAWWPIYITVWMSLNVPPRKYRLHALRSAVSEIVNVRGFLPSTHQVLASHYRRRINAQVIVSIRSSKQVL
jgi:hypothetical protein